MAIDLTTEEGRAKAKCFTCCGCCIFWIVFFCTLLGISIKTLEQGQYALVFSHYQQTVIGEPITDPGMKWVGPLNNLVRYPSVYQMLYFDNFPNYETGPNEILKAPVHSRTYDGLQVFVKISFQWKLEPQHLKDVYGILGGAEDLFDDEERPDDKPSFVMALVRFARGTLTMVCSRYTASEFFANQTLVEQRMYQELSDTFNRPNKSLMISIQDLQLRSVDLPDAYEEAIAETQAEEQDLLTARAERATKEMQMARELMENDLRQTELMVDTLANETAMLEENSAWVEQYLNYQRKMADQYAVILGNLNSSTNPYDNLIELLNLRGVKDHDPHKMTLTM